MSVAALTYAASSDARKSTALATSSGVQSLGIGYSASEASMYSDVALSTAPGVSVRPGATALQRIPRVPYCEATDFVNRTTPALDAPYAARTPRPTKPSTEAVLTIEPPPRASMCGIASLQRMNRPFRLTATRRSKTAMSRVTTSVSTALVEESVALLCNTSRPPNDSTAVSTMRTTLASSETSTSMATALPSSAATRSASAPLISATTTEAPSRAIRRAVASPMPLPAPVTIATLLSSRPTGREYVSAHCMRFCGALRRPHQC